MIGLEKLFLSYPDFKWGETIDPEEVDTNNGEITFKVNQLIDYFNSLIVVEPDDDGDVEGEPGEDGSPGFISINIRGNVVKIRPIAPFDADNVEDYLNKLSERLQSTLIDESGATFIGASEIDGIEGNTVQEQLQAIYTLVKTIVADGATSAELALHIKSGDHDERYYKKAEVDEKVEGFTNELELLDERVTTSTEALNLNIDANKSTLLMMDERVKVLEEFGSGGGLIPVLDADPVDPLIGQMWMLMSWGEGGSE